MNKVAICTHSANHNVFSVGEAYPIDEKLDKGGYLVNGKWIGRVYNESEPDTIDVRDTTGAITASFNKGEARKSKSMMKMLVRAFALAAKARGWGDSKNCAFSSWSGTPYSNNKSWARCVAVSYDLNKVAQNMFDEDPNLKFIDQEAVNFFAENEIYYW